MTINLEGQDLATLRKLYALLTTFQMETSSTWKQLELRKARTIILTLIDQEESKCLN